MAKDLESILRGCGALLLQSKESGAIDGEWLGSQFKASGDAIAHEYLIKELGRAFPGVPIISEEDQDWNRKYSGEYFIIDPIDGTASFAHGFPGWVTQVAFVSDNIPTFSGIYAPESDEYFSAERGKGSYCNGRRLNRSTVRRSGLRLIDNYKRPTGIALRAMRGLGISNYIESGSISLKICRVADSTADIFIKDIVVRDWDVAAPMLVLQEACGYITDIRGNRLSLGKSERRHDGLICCENVASAELVRKWVVSSKET